MTKLIINRQWFQNHVTITIAADAKEKQSIEEVVKKVSVLVNKHYWITSMNPESITVMKHCPPEEFEKMFIETRDILGE